MKDYDIVIAGGGAAGASLALALGRTSFSVALVDPGPPPGASTADQRGLALSPATVRILQALEVWQPLLAAACPIRRIHVSEDGRFGCVRLDAALLDADALGYVVPVRALGEQLQQAIAALPNVTALQGTIVRAQVTAEAVNLRMSGSESGQDLSCRLLVAADGTRSALRDELGISARIHDYHQTAVVASVTPRRSHGNCAWERFSRTGPAALLPLPDGRCVAVLCVASEDAPRYLAMPDEEFLAHLDRRLAGRTGGFTGMGARAAYPLADVEAAQQHGPRAVLLGNAAHTVHPNGAQGFNLAIRDAAALAEALAAAAREHRDPGAEAVLEIYAKARQDDQRRVQRFTRGLAALFYTDHLAPRLARRAAMLLIERAPFLKRALARRAAGISGRQPALVRNRNRP